MADVAQSSMTNNKPSTKYVELQQYVQRNKMRLQIYIIKVPLYLSNGIQFSGRSDWHKKRVSEFWVSKQISHHFHYKN